jgi:hypothetical protein
LVLIYEIPDKIKEKKRGDDNYNHKVVDANRDVDKNWFAIKTREVVMNNSADKEKKRFERQAIKRYYGESGMIDLLIGIASLILSIGMYYDFTYIAVLDIMIIAILNRYLRKKMILPRLGQVEFKYLNKKKLQKHLGNLILIPVVPIILVLIFVPEPLCHLLSLILMFILLIGQAVYRILIYKVYRMFIYLFVFVITFSIMLIMDQVELFVWGGLIMSIMGIAIGLKLVLRFLERNPVLENVDE